MSAADKRWLCDMAPHQPIPHAMLAASSPTCLERTGWPPVTQSAGMMRPPDPPLVWPAALIVWGAGFAATRHRHHCVQLVATTEGTLRIRGGDGDRWTRCGAALVRPDAYHEIDAQGATLVIGFIDAVSDWGAALCDGIPSDIVRISPRRLAGWRRAWGPAPDASRVEHWIRNELLRYRRPIRLHAGVDRVVRNLPERLGRREALSLRTLSTVAGLSPSRFMHAFTESVGIPLRPYILWLRLQRAACVLVQGATATEAAHSAGFSDAAHLTRTFRRMLGLTPTQLELHKRMIHGALPDR
jgi:AraC-like DNA-binding protein